MLLHLRQLAALVYHQTVCLHCGTKYRTARHCKEDYKLDSTFNDFISRHKAALFPTLRPFPQKIV